MTQAWSDGQSTLVVHLPHDPPAHGPQTPALQKLPVLAPSQSVSFWQAGVQTPAVHPSPGAQSLLAEHVHCIVVWVAVQVA